jgi:tRNA A-37 threonylcarbamoyl transferase component Bud32
MSGGEFVEGGRYRSYRLLRRLGEGGMGAVWLAEHVHTEHRIAIKLMVPPSLQGIDIDAERYLARFKREATIMTRFNHPNVPAIYDMDIGDDGRGVIQMEYLDGRDLRYVLDSLRASGRRCSVIDALYIGVEVAKPMQIAHRMGIVHRDLKPENIFLCRGKQPEGKGQVRVLDFGIAHYDNAHRITSQSNVLGTFLYMPPEVLLCHDDETDGRADIYALGVVLWEALAGQHPHLGDRARIPDNQVLGRRVIEDAVPALHEVRADVPEELGRFVGRMLAKKPAERARDMETVQQELSRLLVELQRQVGGQTMFTRAGVTLPERAAATPLLASNGFVSPERTTPMPRSAGAMAASTLSPAARRSAGPRAPRETQGALAVVSAEVEATRAATLPLSAELERVAALPPSSERTRGIEQILLTHDDAAVRARAVQLLAETSDEAVLPTLAFAALWERERSEAVLEAIDAALSARIPALHPTRTSPQALPLDPSRAPASVHRVLDILYWLEDRAGSELGSRLERTLITHPFATIRYAAADALRRTPRLLGDPEKLAQAFLLETSPPVRDAIEEANAAHLGWSAQQAPRASLGPRAPAGSAPPLAALRGADHPDAARAHSLARQPPDDVRLVRLAEIAMISPSEEARATAVRAFVAQGDGDARLALLGAALCELEASLPLREIVEVGLAKLAPELGPVSPGVQTRMGRVTRLSHLANALEQGYDDRAEQLFVLDAFGLSMLNHPFVELRSLSAQALARVGDARCLPMLGKAGAAETDRHVRRYIEEARAAIEGRAERAPHTGGAREALAALGGRRVWLAIGLGMVVAALGILGWMLIRGHRRAQIPGGAEERKASATGIEPEVALRRGVCPLGEGRGDA